ncbi:hypothetical protein KSP39_PZI007768 [Platanthera zijinensis]|uniref:Uncharacterized protein n=1 Tax=Platanthera zijinensis TaxID=2320716 RepID=A0AAP0BPR1_9ASPA
MGCALKGMAKENDQLRERNKRLSAVVAQLKEKETRSYDIENPDFQDAMMPFVKESIEVAVLRFIELGHAKEGVVDVPFFELFPELKRKVTAMERAARGEAAVSEEEEDEEETEEVEVEVEDEQEIQEAASNGLNDADQEAKSLESTSKDSSSVHTPSEYASSESDDSGSTSEGFSPLEDKPESPVPATKKLKPSN